MTLEKKLNHLRLLERSRTTIPPQQHNLGKRGMHSRSESRRCSLHQRNPTNSAVVIQCMIPTRTVLGGETCLCQWFDKWVGTTRCMNPDTGDFVVHVGQILALGKEPGARHGQPRGMKPQLRRL